MRAYDVSMLCCNHRTLLVYTMDETCRESLSLPFCTLSFRLPVGGSSGGSTATSRLHLGFLKGDDSTTEIKLSTEETIVMCTLVCTADYCVDTTQQVLFSICDDSDTDSIGAAQVVGGII